MTVGELQEKLEDVPNNQKIVLSTDPEGNRYWGAEDAYTEQIWMKDHLVHPEDINEISEKEVEFVTYIAPKHTTP